MIANARQLNPGLRVVVRAANGEEAELLRQAGADEVVWAEQAIAQALSQHLPPPAAMAPAADARAAAKRRASAVSLSTAAQTAAPSSSVDPGAAEAAEGVAATATLTVDSAAGGGPAADRWPASVSSVSVRESW